MKKWKLIFLGRSTNSRGADRPSKILQILARCLVLARSRLSISFVVDCHNFALDASLFNATGVVHEVAGQSMSVALASMPLQLHSAQL